MYNVVAMSKIYVSKNANKILKDYLKNQGHIVEEIKARAAIDEAIQCHRCGERQGIRFDAR